jgi:hypothetical protein
VEPSLSLTKDEVGNRKWNVPTRINMEFSKEVTLPEQLPSRFLIVLLGDPLALFSEAYLKRRENCAFLFHAGSWESGF